MMAKVHEIDKKKRKIANLGTGLPFLLKEVQRAIILKPSQTLA